MWAGPQPWAIPKWELMSHLRSAGLNLCVVNSFCLAQLSLSLSKCCGIGLWILVSMAILRVCCFDLMYLFESLLDPLFMMAAPSAPPHSPLLNVPRGHRRRRRNPKSPGEVTMDENYSTEFQTEWSVKMGVRCQNWWCNHLRKKEQHSLESEISTDAGKKKWFTSGVKSAENKQILYMIWTTNMKRRQETIILRLHVWSGRRKLWPFTSSSQGF